MSEGNDFRAQDKGRSTGRGGKRPAARGTKPNLRKTPLKYRYRVSKIPVAQAHPALLATVRILTDGREVKVAYLSLTVAMVLNR